MLVDSLSADFTVPVSGASSRCKQLEQAHATTCQTLCPEATASICEMSTALDQGFFASTTAINTLLLPTTTSTVTATARATASTQAPPPPPPPTPRRLQECCSSMSHPDSDPHAQCPRLPSAKAAGWRWLQGECSARALKPNSKRHIIKKLLQACRQKDAQLHITPKLHELESSESPVRAWVWGVPSLDEQLPQGPGHTQVVVGHLLEGRLPTLAKPPPNFACMPIRNSTKCCDTYDLREL